MKPDPEGPEVVKPDPEGPEVVKPDPEGPEGLSEGLEYCSNLLNNKDASMVQMYWTQTKC